jgi:hypothetical protein
MSECNHTEVHRYNLLTLSNTKCNKPGKQFYGCCVWTRKHGEDNMTVPAIMLCQIARNWWQYYVKASQSENKYGLANLFCVLDGTKVLCGPSPPEWTPVSSVIRPLPLCMFRVHISGSLAAFFLRWQIVGLSPNPNLKGQSTVFITPGAGWPSFTPGTGYSYL